jgi:ribonuclease PH
MTRATLLKNIFDVVWKKVSDREGKRREEERQENKGWRRAARYFNPPATRPEQARRQAASRFHGEKL